MINVNLISPDQKYNLRFEFIYLGLRQIIFSVIGVMILVSAVFLTARIILEDNYATMVRETTLVNQKNVNIDQEISKINSTLRKIKSIQDNYVKWSSLLVNLSKTFPDGITISALSIEKNTNTIYLQGNAAMRNDLITLEKNLKTKTYLNNITVPITSKLSPVNINFEINAKIDFSEFLPL